MRGFPFSFPHNDILNNSPIINVFTYGFLILVFFFHCNLSETEIIYIVLHGIPTTLLTHNKQHHASCLPLL